MAKDMTPASGGHPSPFEAIKRTNEAGMEFWSSRDFAQVLDYGDYRNFEGVVEKAKLACFNSGHRIEDHFVEVTEMIAIGKGELGRQGRQESDGRFVAVTPRCPAWRLRIPPRSLQSMA